MSLLMLIDEIIYNLNKSELFFDFFLLDKVNHIFLQHNINMVYNNELSSEQTITCGIPQGSILLPPLCSCTYTIV